MDDTSADLRSLLDRLKGAQHALIEDAARQPGLPSMATIRKIADLENASAAVLAFIEEREGSR
jgi:hypothetical protein